MQVDPVQQQINLTFVKLQLTCRILFTKSQGLKE
jgi:hypothetical protein